MSKINPKTTIYEACKIFDKEIKTDFGGGSSIEKTFLMSYLVQNQNLKSFAEIGVYRGKSFFPTAYSIKKNKGKSYGIDPYSFSCAKENDVEKNLKLKIDIFLEKLNFEEIYKNVTFLKKKYCLNQSVNFIKKSSEKAYTYFKKNNIELDIVHIDGNHDTKHVKQDYELYYDILKNGGFFVFDDINWDSVNVIYKQAKKECLEIFSCDTFGILLKQPKNTLTLIQAEKLTKRLNEIYTKIIDIKSKDTQIPNISVGILTYNHVNYIEKCINSVVSQVGKFNLSIYICDDCSTDGNSQKIQDILSKIPQTKHLKIYFIKNEKNLGIISNLKNLVNLLRGSDYFTFCEGDDYYLSKKRISEHLKYHIRKPETVLSFNKLLMYFQNKNEYKVFEPNQKSNFLTTEKLIEENFIGNFSACFYNSRVLNYVKDDLFDIYTVDWMFNIFCSQYGDIVRLKKPLNVYRVHDKGIWSGLEKDKKLKILTNYIDQYNIYLNFSYNSYFTEFKNKCISGISSQGIEQLDIAVIDDVFPHTLSGFRYQEFTSILETFGKSTVFKIGTSHLSLGNKNIEEILIEYKRKWPELAARVQKIYDIVNFNYKIIYCTFLNNAYSHVILTAEKHKVPFIFTLYPGAGFGLDNKESDDMLRRVFNSPCFKKVIVTQNITYKYLIRKRLCPKEKIEFIYGIVMPLEKLQLNITNKKHYKFGKETLDICFVAHKYTEFGEDKGYDIFIAVAKKLSQKYKNVNFHIVGSFDKNVIDTKGIKNITFYGTQEQNWFDRFYLDKDIILSPNVNNKIFKGNFDGFPTGCCTDAAIRKVAMFCTDPLNLNIKFTDGENIVIIEHNTDKIVKKIEKYIDNPKKLKDLCEKSCEKVKEIYNYENQIKPRLKILEQAINEPFIYKESFMYKIIKIKSNCQKIQKKIKIIINKIADKSKKIALLLKTVKSRQINLIKKKCKSILKIQIKENTDTQSTCELFPVIKQLTSNKISNRKKVLILPSWYPTADNPLIGTFFQEQSLLMTPEYDVKVLFGQPKERLDSLFIKSDNDIITPPEGLSFYYDINPKNDENVNLNSAFLSYKTIVDELISNGWKPDLIHAHCSVYGGIIANYLGKIMHIPTMITEHQIFLLNNYSKFLQDKITEALQETNLVGAVSTDKMKFILMHGIKCNPTVLGNMVDDELFKIKNKEKDNKIFNILIVAGASFIKDLPTFFYSIKEVVDRNHKDIHAKIVGNGIWGNENYKELVDKLNLKKYCTFIDIVERKNMPKFYQESDVFVSTSIAEGFQVSVLEAMACGKPIVTTSNGGVEDIISKDNGIMVKIRDFKAIADALINIKTGKINFNSENIRSIVVNKYGKHAFKSKISKIYDNLIENYK